MRMRATFPALVATAILLVAACGNADTTPTASPPASASPAATDSTEAPLTPSGTPPAPTDPTPPPEPFDPTSVSLSFEVVTGGLEAPLAIAAPSDGSGRIFVAEQIGRVRIVRDGDLIETPFLDIADRIAAGGERGLLGLAFHPDYPDDPRVLVNYTDRNGTTTISSFPVGDDPDRADASNETVLLTIQQPYGNHNGGAVAFGPDGYLYISTGDGGSGGDPHHNGQRLDTLLGKILRIDIDATGGGGEPYDVPDDNPFVGDANGRPEIWHSGLRNPWRMGFDRATGDLWIGDVGQGSWEEVDVARAGASGLNFGWNRMEGFECFQFARCDDPKFTAPVAAYGHDLGCSVVGGTVYRGEEQAALAGGYVFADYCTGNVWLLDPATDGRQNPPLVLESGHGISAFGENELGELFATDLGSGELLRLVATPS